MIALERRNGFKWLMETRDPYDLACEEFETVRRSRGTAKNYDKDMDRYFAERLRPLFVYAAPLTELQTFSST